MKVAVVIPSRTAHLVAGCLGSMKFSTGGLEEGEVGIFVVANGSDEEAAAVDGVVREFNGAWGPKAVVRCHRASAGFYGNFCDDGVEVARPFGPQFIVFLNDDTYPCTGWLENLVLDHDQALKQGHRPGLIGARGTAVSGPQNIFDPTELACRQKMFRAQPEMIMQPLPVAFTWPRIVTFAALCSLEAYDEVFGFDGALQAHNFSDDILSLRMLRKGRHNFVSKSFVAHLGSRTVAAGATLEEAKKRYDDDMAAGLAYYQKEYPTADEELRKELDWAGMTQGGGRR